MKHINTPRNTGIEVGGLALEAGARAKEIALEVVAATPMGRFLLGTPRGDAYYATFLSQIVATGVCVASLNLA